MSPGKGEDKLIAPKYVIGLDFGTKSGRALIVDSRTGETIAQSVKEYPHGVMDSRLPDGTTVLGAEWFLQHPGDYIDVLESTTREALGAAGIRGADVIGLSIDFTACTILPVDRSATPLCFQERFAHRPHAYVKLWKHHAAQSQAKEIDELLAAEGLLDSPRFGGKVSSELMLPKILQIVEEDPEIYDEADSILEASDWLTRLLTGETKRSGSTAAYKAMWQEGEGYPPPRLLKALNPRLERLAEQKLAGEICPVGKKLGELNAEWAGRLGLQRGTAVGASVIDAHAGLPGCGITRPGQMMLILGTSSVQAVLSERGYSGEGVLGGVKGGIIPGYYAWESGLAGVGDMLEWFVTNSAPAAYKAKADSEGASLYQYLSARMQDARPGSSGLLAIDWWSGNKTPFVDADLSGLVLGYTMKTKPEEVYRALVEATGFGTRMIMDAFREGGEKIDEIYACGGIAEKDAALMQIYADITGCEIKVSASEQTCALGATMYASVAAGAARGGYDTVAEAAAAMSRIRDEPYKPNGANAAIYGRLYGIYEDMYAYFGGEGSPMKRLKGIRDGAGPVPGR